MPPSEYAADAQVAGSDEALGQACAVILTYLAKQIAREVVHLQQQQQQQQPQPAAMALRIDDAARLLNISAREVHRRVLRGEIPSIKIGKLRRIPPSAIQALLDGRS